MNELTTRAAAAQLQNAPKEVLVNELIQVKSSATKFRERMRKEMEKVAAGTMEVVKVAGTAGGAALAGVFEAKLPDYEYIGETPIPTVGAIGGAMVAGSFFLPGESAGVIRSVGAGMVAAAAYSMTKTAMEA